MADSIFSEKPTVQLEFPISSGLGLHETGGVDGRPTDFGGTTHVGPAIRLLVSPTQSSSGFFLDVGVEYQRKFGTEAMGSNENGNYGQFLLGVGGVLRDYTGKGVLGRLSLLSQERFGSEESGRLFARADVNIFPIQEAREVGIGLYYTLPVSGNHSMWTDVVDSASLGLSVTWNITLENIFNSLVRLGEPDIEGDQSIPF
jgi:hypothetical protein